ncbi:MAG: hypothetical protein V3R93_07845, partial [Candidatus Hydrothermarchaeaceae archaeon]
LNIGNTNIGGTNSVTIRNGDVVYTGADSVVMGVAAANGVTGGFMDIFIGRGCGGAGGPSGGFNVFIGGEVASAGGAMTGQEGNVMIGKNCGRDHPFGNDNTCVGRGIMGNTPFSGAINEDNTFFGRSAAISVGNMHHCVFLGSYCYSATPIPNPTPINHVIIIGSLGLMNGNVPDRTVHIGGQCDAAGAVGRLAFGNAMETPHGTFAMPNSGVPEAYIKMEWNGTLYYIPAFTTAPV